MLSKCRNARRPYFLSLRRKKVTKKEINMRDGRNVLTAGIPKTIVLGNE
jgi:hypothetical protein